MPGKVKIMTVRLGSTPSPLEDRAGEVPLAQLVRRVAASDLTAFVLLYDALSSEVRQQVGAVLSAGDAVDAVVAATFLQVWWLAPFRGPDDEDVPAWIRGIASGRIADRRRNAVVTPPADHVPAQQRLPWSVLSGAYDETVGVVLAGLLGRRGPQKAF
jgi:DNA-directed RNA polymerase specialized sigma24 family protein